MHGHSLIIKYINLDKNIIGKTVIEIGSTREQLTNQDSTKHLYMLSVNKSFNFITVDMDPQVSSNIIKRFENIRSICQRGEDFLKEYSGNIDYLYMDAFDFFHNNHSNSRVISYEKNLNTTINDKDCHKMHLDCVKNVFKKIKNGGYIVIDDCFGINFERGKGVTAIPFLLKNGFKVVDRNDQAVALKKI